MKKFLFNLLRWITFIPAAILSVPIIKVILSFLGVLVASEEGNKELVYSQMYDGYYGGNLILMILGNLLPGFFIVYIACSIALRYKFRIAQIFTIATIAFTLVNITYRLIYRESETWDYFTAALRFICLTTGVVISYNIQKKDDEVRKEIKEKERIENLSSYLSK